MAPAYPVHAIEKKWRDAWRTNECFRAADRPGDATFFNFDSGPFPNGPLHMGHVRTYVLGDVVARYQRLLGKSVLYCTEWDAFGLPNELAAQRAGMSPADYTATNIRRMREGLERLGISYDWSRVQSTCDPKYYRWTQWLFLALYRRGLAYRKESIVNWCPTCETSVASMQIEDDACWRCTSPIDQRKMPQWYVATSQFAERLHSGVDGLDAWSKTGRRLLMREFARQLSTNAGRDFEHDWLVSRSPFAPYLAEEVAAMAGHDGLVATARWPDDEKSPRRSTSVGA